MSKVPSKLETVQSGLESRGSSYRSIVRILKVNPQRLVNSVSQYANKLPNAPMPAKVKKAELDELYTFVGKKKTKSIF
jgi:hypothetical protein